MHGPGSGRATMCSYVDLEQRIPANRPLRAMEALVAPMLRARPRFDALYEADGRPSIPPEQLLRALLLQVLYTIPSERQFLEQLDHSRLFRRFVGFGMDAPVWHPSTLTFQQPARGVVWLAVTGSRLAPLPRHRVHPRTPGSASLRSATVSYGKSCGSSGTTTSARLASTASANAPCTRQPLIRTSPPVGRTSPAMLARVVVLPAPLGPIRPMISPGRTARLARSHAVDRTRLHPLRAGRDGVQRPQGGVRAEGPAPVGVGEAA